LGQPRITICDFTAVKGAKTRVWDNPTNSSFRDMQIWITSKGVVNAIAIKWEVLYGGRWQNEPFDSAHDGGVHQANNTIAGGAEVVKLIHQDKDAIFPANSVKTTSPPQDPNAGFPLVVEIDNTLGADDVSATVIFLSRETADSQI
jgi:hypothetical protein